MKQICIKKKEITKTIQLNNGKLPLTNHGTFIARYVFKINETIRRKYDS